MMKENQKKGKNDDFPHLPPPTEKCRLFYEGMEKKKKWIREWKSWWWDQIKDAPVRWWWASGNDRPKKQKVTKTIGAAVPNFVALNKHVTHLGNKNKTTKHSHQENKRAAIDWLKQYRHPATSRPPVCWLWALDKFLPTISFVLFT